MKVIRETQSICPICKKPQKGFYVSSEGHVFLRKTCEDHGAFESLVAEHEEDFLKWMENPVINVAPLMPQTHGAPLDQQCPLHCGICDNHLQTACCVLIDVTDRCNQKCSYCFAKAEGDTGSDPSLLEMEEKFDLLLKLGEERTYNIQLSGGEPTVRDDLPEIIKIGRTKGFPHIQINTNGRRIAMEEGYAETLKQAGATVIFMQFDGTTDEIQQKLRGEALLNVKKKAVENCRKAGIPVTLVPTIVKDVNLKDIGNMMEFLWENVDIVKGIHFQPVSFFGRFPDEPKQDERKRMDYENRVTMFDIMHELELQTDGKLKYDDFYSITTGHPLCCFQSTYQRRPDGSIKSLISQETKAAGVSCCSTKTPLEIIEKDRNFVGSKWKLADETSQSDCEKIGCDCDNSYLDFDQFLADMRRGMFSVSCMAFQDIGNMDAERLKRCRVQVLAPNNRLIPFCAYNSIYRDQF